MSDLLKIFLTVTLTIVGGLLVFVLQKFVLDPIADQSKVLGRIVYALHFYANRYNLPLKRNESAHDEIEKQKSAASGLRELASCLAEKSQCVRLYGMWAFLGLIPGKKRVDAAIGQLTGLSNSLFAEDSGERRDNTAANWAAADDINRMLGLRRWGK